MVEQISFEEYNPGMVDHVLGKTLKTEDEVLQRIRDNCRQAKLPEIEVSAHQGKFLELLVATSGSIYALEIGTLGGYSTVCIARGLRPGGIVTTIEYDEYNFRVARANIEQAGYEPQVDMYLGSALEVLPALGTHYDFVFIDADKENNEAYFKWALQLTDSGSTIVVDNVIRDGRVLAPNRPEKLAFIEYLATQREAAVSVVQTVGSKGWDGFVLARKL